MTANFSKMNKIHSHWTLGRQGLDLTYISKEAMGCVKRRQEVLIAKRKFILGLSFCLHVIKKEIEARDVHLNKVNVVCNYDLMVTLGGPEPISFIICYIMYAYIAKEGPNICDIRIFHVFHSDYHKES